MLAGTGSDSTFSSVGLQKLKIAGLCVAEEPEGRWSLRDSCGTFLSHVQQCGIAQRLAEVAEGQDLLFSGSVCWLGTGSDSTFSSVNTLD